MTYLREDIALKLIGMMTVKNVDNKEHIFIAIKRLHEPIKVTAIINHVHRQNTLT